MKMELNTAGRRPKNACRNQPFGLLEAPKALPSPRAHETHVKMGLHIFTVLRLTVYRRQMASSVRARIWG